MSKKTEDLRKIIDNYLPNVGKTYAHYRTGIYKIVGVAFDTTEDAPVYVYERVDGPYFNQLAESGIKFTRLVSEWEAKAPGEYPPGHEAPARFVEVSQQTIWNRV